MMEIPRELTRRETGNGRQIDRLNGCHTQQRHVNQARKAREWTLPHAIVISCADGSGGAWGGLKVTEQWWQHEGAPEGVGERAGENELAQLISEATVCDV